MTEYGIKGNESGRKSSESRKRTKSLEQDLMRVKSAAAAAIAGATGALAVAVLHQVM